MEPQLKKTKQPIVGPNDTFNAGDLSIDATDPQLLEKARNKWKEYGCFVVRGLNKSYVGSIAKHVERVASQSISLEKAGMADRIKEGWVTPDGTLFIPAHWDGTRYEKNRDSVLIADVAAVKEERSIHLSGTTNDSLPAAALYEDGTLREKQIMVLGLDYNTSSALLRCAMDDRTLDVVSAIFRNERENGRQDNLADGTNVSENCNKFLYIA